MRTLQFGISLAPNIADMSKLRELVQLADTLGLDLLGIQDHPYVSRFFDTMSLIAVLLAETRRLRIFPNVASLPLRPPAMLAKSAASLDILSGGRFELGIGSGASWEGIAAIGEQRRAPGEARSEKLYGNKHRLSYQTSVYFGAPLAAPLQNGVTLPLSVDFT